MDPKAPEDVNVKDASRARVRRYAVSIAIVFLIILVLLIGYLVIARMLYDDADRYENNDVDLKVWSAVPVGTNMTAALYRDSVVDRPHGYTGNDVFVAFLDESGHYKCPPIYIPDVPFEGGAIEHDGASTVVHGTTSGITIVYRPLEYQKLSSPTLRCIRVDALTGAITPWLEPVPGLDIWDYEFQSVQWGDVLHVLAWKHYENDLSYNGSVIYARSLDAGRTWQPPMTILGENVSVNWTILTTREDAVSVLLFGVRDPVRGWNGSVDLLLQSSDGGASFGAPVLLAGDIVTKSMYRSYIAQNPEGPLLLLTYTYFGESLQRGLALIMPNGVVDRIIPATSSKVPIVELLIDDEHPRYFRADAYRVLTYEDPDYRIRLDTYSIDGDLIGTLRTSRAVLRHHEIFYTRARDGYREGITTRQVKVSGGDMVVSATELLLVEEDIHTEAVTTLGKPYEVIYGHTDAEEEAYAKRTSPVIIATWIALLVFLLAGLHASALSYHEWDRSEMVMWVIILLVWMAMLMPVVFLAGLYMDAHGMFPHPNLYGLMYVVAGQLLVEMRARISKISPPPRKLHVPFAVLGVLLVLYYPGAGIFAVDLSQVIAITLGLFLCPVLVYLAITVPIRFRDEMPRGEHRYLQLAMSIGLFLVALLSLFMPYFMFIGSVHSIP